MLLKSTAFYLFLLPLTYFKTFKCVSLSRHCDGIRDCKDGSDEFNLSNETGKMCSK